MTAPIGLREGINSTPGDSFCLMIRRKWPGIVATSRETGTRSASAAIRRTSGSGCRPGSTPPAPRKSIAGSRRRNPRPISGLRSASAWKRRLKPAALPFRSSLAQNARSCREGVAGRDLFVATILIFEIRLDFFWMLQDKRNCAVDLGQRSDRRVGIKDRFGRPPIPKIVCNHVKSNSGSGDVVSTVPNFHMLVGRHHGDSTYSLLHLALALIVEERPSAATRVTADAPPHPLHSGAALPLIRIRNANESETTSRFSSLI